MPTLEFRILGPLEVRRDGERIAIPAPRQRALLGYLLLRANEPVPADELIDQLWGDDAPPTARASLHNHVHALRRVVGATTLGLEPSGYVLHVQRGQLDLERFERLAAEARQAEPHGACREAPRRTGVLAGAAARRVPDRAVRAVRDQPPGGGTALGSRGQDRRRPRAGQARRRRGGARVAGRSLSAAGAALGAADACPVPRRQANRRVGGLPAGPRPLRRRAWARAGSSIARAAAGDPRPGRGTRGSCRSPRIHARTCGLDPAPIAAGAGGIPLRARGLPPSAGRPSPGCGHSRCSRADGCRDGGAQRRGTCPPLSVIPLRLDRGQEPACASGGRGACIASIRAARRRDRPCRRIAPAGANAGVVRSRSGWRRPRLLGDGGCGSLRGLGVGGLVPRDPARPLRRRAAAGRGGDRTLREARRRGAGRASLSGALPERARPALRRGRADRLRPPSRAAGDGRRARRGPSTPPRRSHE